MSNKVSPLGLRLNKNKNWKFNFISDKKNYPLVFNSNFELENYLRLVLNSKKLKFIKTFIYNNSKTVYIYVYYKIRGFKFFKIRGFNFKKFKVLIYGKNKNFKKFKRYKKIFNFLVIKRIKIFLYFNYLNIKISKMYCINTMNFKFFFFPINCFKNSNKESLISFKTFLKRNKKLRKISKLVFFSIFTKNSYILTKFLSGFLYRRRNHKKYLGYIIKDLTLLLNLNKYFIGFRIQLKGKLNGRLRAKTFCSKKGSIPLSTHKAFISYYFLPMKTKFGIFGIKVWLVYKNKKI